MQELERRQHGNFSIGADRQKLNLLRELRKVCEKQCVLEVGESSVHLRVDPIHIFILRILGQRQVACGVDFLPVFLFSCCFALAVIDTSVKNIFEALKLVIEMVTGRADFGECSNILMRVHLCAMIIINYLE